jgi:hypothetical protein
VSVSVKDAMTGNSVSGASISEQISGATGLVTFTALSSPVCYLYRATKGGALRSNTFYLAVF